MGHRMETGFVDNLAIIKYPDPRLSKACKPVSDFDDDLRKLAKRMLELMKERKGIGLAGPQVGFMRRILVCSHSGEPGDDLVIINPQLSDLEGWVEGVEGCLSIPDVQVPIWRAQRCKLKAQDAAGHAFEMVGEDLQARVWQHENDHFHGKLILDYMNEASKIANRRIIKQLEASFKG